MGKRKRTDREIRRKIKRLKKRLNDSIDSSENSNASSSDGEYHRRRDDESEVPAVRISDTDSGNEVQDLESIIQVPPAPSANIQPPSSFNTLTGEKPETPAIVPLTADILEALGDPKVKDEVFGPKIPGEISQRWGRILVDGLTKEQKLEMKEKILIPDNFRLIKAPILNPEISTILSDSARNRDRALEKDQNYLGLGIAALTALTSSLIESEINKIEIIRRLSETSQILLDLHFENTKMRRKLLMSSLDKKFTSVVMDVKRDSMLFGENLGEKIKATKTAEKSGLQVKRDVSATIPFKKYPSQGNWKSPPKHGQRGSRPSGHKSRYPPPRSYKRPRPTEQSQPFLSKTGPRPQK